MSVTYGHVQHLQQRIADLERQLSAREAQLQQVMEKLIAIIPTAIGFTGDELGEIVEAIRDGKASLRAYVEGLLPPEKHTFCTGDFSWNSCIEQIRENLNKSLE